MDTMSDAFNGRNAATVVDTMNVKYNYGPSDFYVGKRFVTSMSYDLPFMKQNKILGGWGTNFILTLQDGVPITPYSSSTGYDLNKNGISQIA